MVMAARLNELSRFFWTTMRRNIWIVSQLYFPEETSTGYLLTKIAEGLAEHFSVRVLTGQPGYAGRGMRAPASERDNGVMVRRCPATTWKKDIPLCRLINAVTISISIFAHGLWWIKRRDYVLVVTNPPLLPFLAAAICHWRGAKCLLLIHDVYPDVMVVTGIVKPGSVVHRLGVRLNRWLYRRSERIIVLGRDMKALVARRLEPDGGCRIVIIPNWGDCERVAPLRREENVLLAELGLGDKFVVQYAGNMGYPNDLETVVESARVLRDREKIHFLFIGSGARRDWVEKMVRREQLKNVSVLLQRPRSDEGNFLNACDLAIIPLVRGMAGVGVPSRMYNIMAAGKPIIAVVDGDSELALVVREEEIGWVVPPSCPKQLVETILQAQSEPERLTDMGRRARAVADEKYTLDRVIEAYRSLIDSLDGG